MNNQVMIFFFALFALPLVLWSISTASAQACGLNYHSASSSYSSYLTSPNYPNYYPSSTSCQWTITAPTGYVIELTFITFDTEGYMTSSSGCSGFSDTLEVYNGRYASSSQLLGKYCKDYLPPNVYSSGTALFLKFRSYYGTNGKGFKIKFKAIFPKPDSTICSPFNTYSQNNAIKYSGSSGYIKSPLYGTKYPSNIQCTWIITVPEGKRVKLSFNDFEVDNQFSYCSFSSYSYDYLEIRDGQYSYSTSLKKLCSTTIPSPIYSTGRYMWIRFKSNSDNYIAGSTSGFKAKYEAETEGARPTTFSVSESTSNVTGIVIGIVIGVFVVISLVAICVCIAKRSSPGNVNVPPPTTQNTAAATTQYPQQVGGGSVPHPQVGYSQVPHGNYPPPSQGSYQPQPAGSYPPPPQGSYQPAPVSSFPPPAGSTSAPVGYPPQSSIPLNAYQSQTIPDVPPPPYPGAPSYPLQPTAPAFPYPTLQGVSANPNPPYPSS